VSVNSISMFTKVGLKSVQFHGDSAAFTTPGVLDSNYDVHGVAIFMDG
jgi:hypothetical protein